MIEMVSAMWEAGGWVRVAMLLFATSMTIATVNVFTYRPRR